MDSLEEPNSPLPVLSASSIYAPFILEGHALLIEKLNIQNYVRRGPLRHHALWLLLSLTAASILFANLVWAILPRDYRLRQIHLSLDDGDKLEPSRIPDSETFQRPANLRTIALVSYTTRSRTSILDSYLRKNLATNGGMLDKVVFVPETGIEEDVDWLQALVASTPGYYLVSKPQQDGENSMDGQEWYQEIGNGQPFTRSWNLALSASGAKANLLAAHSPHPIADSQPSSEGSQLNLQTLYLFIHSETIFLGPQAILKLIFTRLTHPSYTFVHANVINQPVLSWIHHHLGVVRPYRPETIPPIRPPLNTSRPEASPTYHPWWASALPLWTEEHIDNTSNVSPSGPTLFNIPIDFHPPFRGHRWLPYHPRFKSRITSEADTSPAGQDAESISTPITQALISIDRPGKWPWTLSALHLYSFLEHLECQNAPPDPHRTTNSTETMELYNLSCTETGDLSRYNMGLWEYQTERYGLSFFIMDERDIHAIGPLQRITEVNVLGGIRDSKNGGGRDGGAVIEGMALGVLFVGSGEREGDREDERNGLESTDLLGRFAQVSEEGGGRDRLGGL